MEREEARGGGLHAPQFAQRVSQFDLRSQRVWPGVRWAGLPKAEPGDDAGPRRRATAPIDSYTAGFGSGSDPG